MITPKAKTTLQLNLCAETRADMNRSTAMVIKYGIPNGVIKRYILKTT